MSGTCFTIQPFDGGKFDKRFDDVYKGAIKNAGMTPYRVDRDPSIDVPIDEIKTRIDQSTICLVDISTNNPNVWFEFGYAMASQKDICIVCSDERSDCFPFDVQHLSIIKYKTESSSDFVALASKITEKLKALLVKQKNRAELPSKLIKTDHNGLNDHERACLASIVMEGHGLMGSVSHWVLKQEMEKQGYNAFATNIALASLSGNEMISIETAIVHDFNEPENVELYTLTQKAWDWVSKNIPEFELKTPPNNDDDPPF